jgi:hypothetical protein
MLKFEFPKQVHTKHNKFNFFPYINKNLKGENMVLYTKKVDEKISSLK